MILAAGEGRRMRPLTADRPKPLVSIGGRPILDHALGKLKTAGIEHVVINLHYKGALIEDYLADHTPPGMSVAFSREETVLDTGGGIKKALPLLGQDPFFAINGDSFWIDGPSVPALDRMAAAWNPDRMDMLLLLQPVDRMRLTTGIGDYDRAPNGRLTLTPDHRGGFMWTSIRIVKPSVFADTPAGPFSFLEVMDRAETAGRLYGLVHDGDWHHLSTAADVAAVNHHVFGGAGVTSSPSTKA